MENPRNTVSLPARLLREPFHALQRDPEVSVLSVARPRARPARAPV